MDYYAILGLGYEPTLMEINLAYGTLALRHHPKVCKDNPSETYRNFCKVSEAYEVLSNTSRRTFYDRWGEEKLKQGIFMNERLRKEQEAEEMEEAARQIQISFRYRHKKIKKEQDEAATMIQRKWQDKQKIRVQKEQEKENKSASMIQKHYRRRLAGNPEYQKRHEQQMAAKTIQKQWHRRQTNIHEEQDQAAGMIQGQWKAKQELRKRRMLKEQGEAAQTIQTKWKYKRKKEKDMAARQIQGRWKKKQDNPKYKARKEKERLKREREAKEEEDAANMIQAQWKNKQKIRKRKKQEEDELKDTDVTDEETRNKRVFKGGYHFSGEPEKIFESFFGTSDPYVILNDKSKANLKEILGTESSKYLGNPGPKCLVVQVDCTLKELYNGCQKQVTYKRTVLNQDGRTLREVTETKSLVVKAGYSKETEITYEGLGHEAAGLASSDLVFKVNTSPVENYKREQDNLVYTATVSLANALCAKPVTLVTLDGRTLKVSMERAVTPTTVKVVHGEGMPIFDFHDEAGLNPVCKGDLYIRFKIVFPQSLNLEQQKLLTDALC